MTWPNLFVIGGPRCGTTNLNGLLGAHPEIFMSSNKEPWFYALEGIDQPFSGPGDGQGIRERSAYGALFDDARGFPAIGEASTLYLASHRAPRALRSDVPDARLIAVLRDPIERAFSNYNQHRWQGREDLSFADALEAGPDRVAGGWAPFWDYRAMSRYGEQLARWYEAFPAEQIHVVIFDELLDAQAEVLNGLFRFVGVASVELSGEAGPVNAAGRPRWAGLHAFLRGSSRAKRALQWAVPGGVTRRIRAEIDRRNRTAAGAVPDDVRAVLRNEYAGQLRQVEELTGLTLPDWLG